MVGLRGGTAVIGEQRTELSDGFKLGVVYGIGPTSSRMDNHFNCHLISTVVKLRQVSFSFVGTKKTDCGQQLDCKRHLVSVSLHGASGSAPEGIQANPADARKEKIVDMVAWSWSSPSQSF
jgi:hypothetical protein